MAAECELNSNSEIITDNNGFVDCTSSVGTQRLKIQYIGLCA